MTEITETRKTNKPFRGILYYDASCQLCQRTLQIFRPLLDTLRFQALPFPGKAPGEIKLHLPDSEIKGGADALLYILKFFPPTLPFWLLSFIPGMRPLLHSIYKLIAKNRYKIMGKTTCDCSGQEGINHD